MAAWTGTFGSSTERGLSLVQRVNGLPETGTVDARHRPGPRPDGERLLFVSTPAPAGTIVQIGREGGREAGPQLVDRRRASGLGGADGIFGTRTQAVRGVSEAKGLPVTGSSTPPPKMSHSSQPAAATPTHAPPSSGVRRTAHGSAGPTVSTCSRRSWRPAWSPRRGRRVFGEEEYNALVIYQRINGLRADRGRRRSDGPPDGPDQLGRWQHRQAAARRPPGTPSSTSGGAGGRAAEGPDQGGDLRSRGGRRPVRIGDRRGGASSTRRAACRVTGKVDQATPTPPRRRRSRAPLRPRRCTIR